MPIWYPITQHQQFPAKLLTGVLDTWYHPIFEVDGYSPIPKVYNRVYVIGMDSSNNMVYGESVDTTINGEMLDPVAESMITNSADAQTIADIVKRKQRLNQNLATIQINPNCGVELFDPIRAIDLRANQPNTAYRVKGYTFDYQCHINGVQEKVYEMKLTLCGI